MLSVRLYLSLPEHLPAADALQVQVEGGDGTMVGGGVPTRGHAPNTFGSTNNAAVPANGRVQVTLTDVAGPPAPVFRRAGRMRLALPPHPAAIVIGALPQIGERSLRGERDRRWEAGPIVHRAYDTLR